VDGHCGEANAVLKSERDLVTAYLKSGAGDRKVRQRGGLARRLSSAIMRAPPSTSMFPQQASWRRCSGGCISRPFRSTKSALRPLTFLEGKRFSGFTLLELLIVIGIVAVLLVLIAPGFTSLKSARDVTSAAYTIKGVLDTARTYAKANNTYTWIGFYEEDVSQASIAHGADPCTGCMGRLVLSIVASKDGTTVYDPNSLNNPDPINPAKLVQVGKLIKLENVHLPLFAAGTGTGDTFDARPSPSPASDANYSRFGELNVASPTAPITNSQFPFWYPLTAASQAEAQYYFKKTLQFSPRGDSRINSTYDIRRVVEVGLLQTHGTATPVPVSGGGTSNVVFSGNVAAVQINGFAGDVKIYRR
jgi:prepilin-type N-terminal cleavage/methylation domain-containing protein